MYANEINENWTAASGKAVRSMRCGLDQFPAGIPKKEVRNQDAIIES
jgi:hypothetical protein